ncbi:hypothetical protein [Methylophilus aquaticus]|uniref:Uncharacterized protein n=1 Tax=Methylophilus aquaticus TaxID=1971610 RepID=A0ABT9JTU1_9PROT|nr:hypothetical protein [Methylophilus aquaticus]MDP8567968.1 hypothetical protein [Methylophilus aquaticus]
MSHQNTISEFEFVINKSFLGRGNLITIPSRFYQAIKENGLNVSTNVILKFMSDPALPASINIGWRSGGKYYQIRINSHNNLNIHKLQLGQILQVRICKFDDNWHVELNKKNG